jgi:hypothetical protein
VDYGSDGDTYAKGNDRRSRDIRGAVSRHHYWHTINDSWIVRWHVHYLRIRRLNDNRLETFLNDLDLRT